MGNLILSNGSYISSSSNTILVEIGSNLNIWVNVPSNEPFESQVISQTIEGTCTANATVTFTANTNVSFSAPTPTGSEEIDGNVTYDRTLLPLNSWRTIVSGLVIDSGTPDLVNNTTGAAGADGLKDGNRITVTCIDPETSYYSQFVTETKPYQAIKSIDFTNEAVLFGVGGTGGATNRVAGLTNYNAVKTMYPWIDSLGRAIYMMNKVAEAGCKIYSTWATVTADNGSYLEGFTDPARYTFLTALAQRARELNILLQVRFTAFYPPEGRDGGYHFQEYMDAVTLPALSTVSTLLKDYSDCVVLCPYSEIPNGILQEDWSEYQKQVYDLSKIVAPNLKVSLSSIQVMDGGSFESGRSIIGFLADLYNKGYEHKFDDFVDIHLYPHAMDVITYGRGEELDAHTPIGAGSLQDIAHIVTELDRIGRSDAKIMIGEFGLFWNNAPLEGAWDYTGVITESDAIRIEQKSADDIIELYSLVKSNPRLHSIVYWGDWCREWNAEWVIADGIPGGLPGIPGMGILMDKAN